MTFENIEITKNLNKTKTDSNGKIYIPVKIREICGIEKDGEVSIKVDREDKAILIKA